MVEVQDVRDALANLSIERVPDATIEKQIEIANTTIENEKSATATKDVVEDAKLVMAIFLTLQAYASKLERSIGGVPPEVGRQVDFWQGLHDRFLVYAKRSSSYKEQPAVLTESLEQVVEEVTG